MHLLIALTIAVLVYLLQSRFFRQHWNQQLYVSLSFSEQVARSGDQITLYEVVENRKFLPLPILYVKFKTSHSFLFDNQEPAGNSDYIYRNDIFTLLGYQKITRTLSFTTSKRGYYTIDSLQLISKNLFLTSTLACTTKNTTELYVLPKLLPDNSFTLQYENCVGNALRRRNAIEDPFTFRGIRDYQTFDQPKHINWKSTAHTGSLKVNLYDPTAAKTIYIYLNMMPHYKVRSEDLQEYSIRLAATIVHSLFNGNCNISFFTNGRQKETEDSVMIANGQDSSHYLHIQKSLARISTRTAPSDFISLFNRTMNLAPPDVSIIMISTYRGEDLSNTYLKHLNNGKDIHWICPEFNTITIKEQITGLNKWEVNYYDEMD